MKDYVRQAKLSRQEMFVPLTHAPGEAQADFGEAVVVIAGVEQTAHFLAFDLPHDTDKLGQRVIRPAVEAIGLSWFGWHGFRRGIASNLYELGAKDKIVQRILRHANPHITKERYIKVFDPAVLEAMQRMQATLEVLEKSQATVRQMN